MIWIFLGINQRVVVILVLTSVIVFSSCSKSEPPKPPNPTNIAPTAIGSVDKTSGKIGDTFTFIGSSSNDPDGNNSNINSRWDFDGDGTFDTSYAPYAATVTHKFDAAANYTPILQVKDEKGKASAKKSLSKITITGNTAPVAKGSANKASAEIGETVTFNTTETSDVDGKEGLETRIDADGDGTYDTEWAPYDTPVNYVFVSSVNANPVVEARDSEGLTNTFVLPNLGIYDPLNNPVSINFKVPKYQIAGKEIKATSDVTDANGRPVTYSFDLDGDGTLDVVDGAKQQSFTPTRGKRTLEAMATNDYNVSNSIKKEVEVGPEIPSLAILTDKDGQKYGFNLMNDGSIWASESYRGKVGDAEFYDNDSINNSVFGRYYSAAEIDQIGDENGEIPLKLTNGEIRYVHVATEAEWESLANAYGSSADLKYNAFANGNNVGAKDNSKLSLMLGGANNDKLGYGEQGNLGIYMTATNNSKESKKAFLINNDNANIQILTGVPNSTRAPVRLVLKPKQR